MGNCPIIPYPEHPQLYWWIQMMQFYCTGLSTAFDALNRWTYSGRTIWHFERSGKCWQIHRKKDDDYDDDDDNGRSLLLLFIVSIVLSSLCVHVCCRDFRCHIVRMAALFIYAARVLIFNCTFYAAEFFLLCIYSIRYDIPFLFRSPSVGRWFRIIRNARWRIYNRVHSGTESLQIRASQKKERQSKTLLFLFSSTDKHKFIVLLNAVDVEMKYYDLLFVAGFNDCCDRVFHVLMYITATGTDFFSPFFDSLFCSFIFFLFILSASNIFCEYISRSENSRTFSTGHPKLALSKSTENNSLLIFPSTNLSDKVVIYLPNEFLCNLTHGRMSAVFLSFGS